MSSYFETTFRSSYDIKIIEVIVLLLVCNIVVFIKNASSESLFSLLAFWNVSVIIAYFLIKIPFVKSISFTKDKLKIVTLFSTNEISFNKIELRIMKIPLKAMQDKTLLKTNNKKFVVREVEWPQYNDLIECLKLNIENKYE